VTGVQTCALPILLSQVLSMQVIDRLELGDWERAAAAAAEGEQLALDTDRKRDGLGPVNGCIGHEYCKFLISPIPSKR